MRHNEGDGNIDAILDAIYAARNILMMGIYRLQGQREVGGWTAELLADFLSKALRLSLCKLPSKVHSPPGQNLLDDFELITRRWERNVNNIRLPGNALSTDRGGKKRLSDASACSPGVDIKTMKLSRHFLVLLIAATESGARAAGDALSVIKQFWI
jgi:hypothetical protein